MRYGTVGSRRHPVGDGCEYRFLSFERDPEPNSRLTEPDNGSREGRENQDSTSKILQLAIVACCADESRMVRATRTARLTWPLATRNPRTDYKNARKRENEHVRSIMPMHPLSFGSVKEQTLDFRLSPIPRHRRLTADFRTRRFPDLVVHEFDRSPWRWRTVWRWRTIWRWGAIFGLTNRVAAVLVRVRVVGFFAHHRDALMVLGTPAAASRFFILLMACPCAVSQS